MLWGSLPLTFDSIKVQASLMRGLGFVVGRRWEAIKGGRNKRREVAAAEQVRNSLFGALVSILCLYSHR